MIRSAGGMADVPSELLTAVLDRLATVEANVLARIAKLEEKLTAPPKRFGSITEASVFCGLSVKTLDRMIGRGEVKLLKPVNKKLLDFAELAQVIRSSEPAHSRGSHLQAQRDAVKAIGEDIEQAAERMATAVSGARFLTAGFRTKVQIEKYIAEGLGLDGKSWVPRAVARVVLESDFPMARVDEALSAAFATDKSGKPVEDHTAMFVRRIDTACRAMGITFCRGRETPQRS
jgi:hypothetical protein